MLHHNVQELLAGKLAFRLTEFAHAAGMSMPTLARRIKEGHIMVTRIGATKLISRAEIIRLGLINDAA